LRIGGGFIGIRWRLHGGDGKVLSLGGRKGWVNATSLRMGLFTGVLGMNEYGKHLSFWAVCLDGVDQKAFSAGRKGEVGTMRIKKGLLSEAVTIHTGTAHWRSGSICRHD
jgi:hypothetical protein